ncbi:MAG TPA: hypothetical protein VM345_08805 [Acidimicrobiales bacterium]|nr:hypothetical protein [Acidimicrobiales bacterium]
MLVREALPAVAGNGVGVQAAQTALAVTGIAAGAYLLIAIFLVAIGIVMRWWGTRRAVEA